MNQEDKKELKDLNVAIVHDYLHVVGGAEAVANAIYEIFPNADIYTASYDKQVLTKAKVFNNANIKIVEIPMLSKLKLDKIENILKSNLPIAYPLLNLKKYDLILSSTAHFAKWLNTNKKQIHVSYIHTPPRFLLNLPGENGKRNNILLKPLFFIINNVLKIIDKYYAKKIDYLLCNSRVVQCRIKKFYNRDATIIYPFPSIDESYFPNKIDEEYYLVVSRLSADYKHVDLAIKAAISLGFQLKIIGTGKLENSLKQLTKDHKNIEFLGYVTQEEKIDYLANAKAMICPAEYEDLGMTPLESMWYGVPVIALRHSGYIETIEDKLTGIFFESPTVEDLIKAIENFRKTNFNIEYIKSHALKYSKERFKKEYYNFIKEKLSARS